MAWHEKLRSGRYRGGYRDAQGIKRYVPGTFEQPAEATRKAAVEEDRLRKPGAPSAAAGKQPWGEWAEEWWKKRKVESSTISSDESRLRKHLEPKWSAVSLEKIDQDAIQDWVDELEAREDLAASTVHKIFMLLSSSLTLAVDRERIGRNPCKNVRLPIIPPPDERYLERDEYAALRDKLPTEQDKILADMLVGTGGRWGEVTALHTDRWVSIRRRVDFFVAADSETGEIKAYTKSRKKRSVPVTKDLCDSVTKWLDENPGKCSVKHKQGSVCRGGLIVHDGGELIDYYHWEKVIWRRAVKAAGVGHVRIHDLRHTYASWLRQDGIGLEDIAELLGNTLQVAQRYAHLGSSHWDKVRSVLDGGAAPDLPHEPEPQDRSNVIDFASRRRSS